MKEPGTLPAVEIARAKLTLSLKVEGVRDDGYHLLDAVMVTLDLADRIELTEGTGIEVVEDFGVGDTGARFAREIPTGDENLIARALRVAGRSAAVRLVKRIPAGAGLGGGSADAAAVLRWAGETDAAIAASLGADVPFCVTGGMAAVSGVGEIVEPIDFEELNVVLLTPPFGVSTAAVYRKWDVLGGPQTDGPNDLEVAALAVEERLAGWREVLGRLTGYEPALAGSGSTWFVVLDGPPPPELAQRLAEARISLARNGALMNVCRTER